MTERVGAVVVGAGVVGLAVARALALRGLTPLVLDAESRIGAGQSSRNSEVIHAGIYYQPGSLKARLCVRGKALLYNYCAERALPHRRTGKLIVATELSQHVALDRIAAAAAANGVHDVERWSAERAVALEPALSCTAALWSPSTGIIDSHSFMQSLAGELEAAGGSVVLQTPVVAVTMQPNGRTLVSTPGLTLDAGVFVNCGGLGALALAAAVTGWPPGRRRQPLLPRRLARGNYFSLVGKSPFQHLIYPVPTYASLGTHLTLDLAGAARFGPDVEWLDEVDYTVNEARAPAFYADIRRYWPALPDGTLQPAYAGIRAKLSSEGEAAQDFLVTGTNTHAHMLGIESPGLTSSLALAEYLCENILIN